MLLVFFKIHINMFESENNADMCSVGSQWQVVLCGILYVCCCFTSGRGRESIQCSIKQKEHSVLGHSSVMHTDRQGMNVNVHSFCWVYVYIGNIYSEVVLEVRPKMYLEVI